VGEAALSVLGELWKLRIFEERVRDLRVAGDAVGSIHLGIGQEAIPVGAVRSVGADDALFSTYRGHGWALALGAPAEAIFAEILGRETGINGGRGGSAYFSAPEYRFFGENSIVGASAPIATGAALAGRFDGTNRVAFVVFGDGAMNQGSVHEAMNFAAGMALPVVFLCENNYWSEMTAISDVVAVDELFRRAAGYGIPGERIDGNDVEVVAASVAQAVERARAGGGPSFIEAMTARLVGHYIGDAEQYRRPGELDAARERDPIVLLRARLLGEGHSEFQLDEVERSVREDLEKAVAAALAAPVADPTTASSHVYA
jgi:TPP-dependent pyruvate/acetoin dehydrogenase alpha subunit